MSDRKLTVPAGMLRCAECGRPWLDPGERWFADRMVGDEDNEEQLEVRTGVRTG